MYRYDVRSIPITNVTDKEREVFVNNTPIKAFYGGMIKRSFRIDDEMHDKIMDSGLEAIKVFRYIKSNTNYQTNKVSLKAKDVVTYLNNINIKCDIYVVSKGIKILKDIGFIYQCKDLEVYKTEKACMYLVNPNYYVGSTVDVIFGRIKADELKQYDDKCIEENNKNKFNEAKIKAIQLAEDAKRLARKRSKKFKLKPI